MSNSDIQFINRQTGKVQTEKVYGSQFVKFAYSPIIGDLLAPFISSRFLSKLYGKIQDAALTKFKVEDFVEQYEIDTNLYQYGSVDSKTFEHSFKSFNEFFIREFKPGLREFPTCPSDLAAPAEARYFGYKSIDDSVEIPVKGKFLKPSDLVGIDHYQPFEGGSLVIARLCPVDYHRYHYPDTGKTLESFTIEGKFHSVNPIALKRRANIFISNERRVSILETQNFGKMAYIEVGATCVGKIVQSFNEEQSFNKGDEKGYFLFGASTVILIGEKGRWSPSDDLISNTKNGFETYIQLGETIGSSN